MKTKFYEDERILINAEYPSSNANTSTSAFGTLSKKKSKLQAVSRYAELWISTAPRLKVVGARVNTTELREIGFDIDDETIGVDANGNHLLTGDKYFEAVRHCWRKVFGTVHADPSVIESSLLSNYASSKTWDWSESLNPTYEMLLAYLHGLKHTGLGADGIHNFCWKYGGKTCVEFLLRLLDAHMARHARPKDINQLLKIFPPKGAAEDYLILDPRGVFAEFFVIPLNSGLLASRILKTKSWQALPTGV